VTVVGGREGGLLLHASVVAEKLFRICSGVNRNFVRCAVQQIQLRTEDRQNGDLGAVALLVRGSGGSCNLVQEISYRIIKFS